MNRRVAFLVTHDVGDYDYSVRYSEQYLVVRDLIGGQWYEVTDEEYAALKRHAKYLNSFLGIPASSVMMVEEVKPADGLRLIAAAVEANRELQKRP